jgi:hypothetical protein
MSSARMQILAHGRYDPPAERRCILMNDKYKISLLSIAMAVIVLGSMVAVTGVSAAQSATVGSTSTANVAAASDGTNTVLVAQGAAIGHSTNNIYFATSVGVPAGTQTWIPIGVGTNPCVVYTGTLTHFAIFWNDNGALTGVTIVGTTVTAVPASTLPTTSVAAGTGPTAVYTASTAQTDILYVATGGALMEWSQLGNTAWATTLGGNVLATPAASTTSSGAGITVVVKGTNAIYEMQYSLGGWGGYWHLHDGAIGLGASLVRLGATANMYLVVAGTQGRMWVLYSANDGSTWTTQTNPLGTQNLLWNNLGGVLKSAPATTQGATITNAEAYVVGGDNGIWSNVIVPGTGGAVTGTWSGSSIVGP